MRLSVPLPHLFFFFPSHYFLKHSRMILSFHRQKVRQCTYYTEICKMFICWGHQKVLLPSMFFPLSYPQICFHYLLCKMGYFRFQRLLSQNLRIPELTGHGAVKQTGSFMRAGMLPVSPRLPGSMIRQTRPTRTIMERRNLRPRAWPWHGQVHTGC